MRAASANVSSESSCNAAYLLLTALHPPTFWQQHNIRNAVASNLFKLLLQTSIVCASDAKDQRTDVLFR
jgi:hypothetical protein